MWISPQPDPGCSCFPFEFLKHHIPRRILPIPPAPAVFDQHVIDVGAIGQDHLKTSHYAGIMVEAARFEIPTASETIGPDLPLSCRSQSLREELEAGEEPIKPDGTR